MEGTRRGWDAGVLYDADSKGPSQDPGPELGVALASFLAGRFSHRRIVCSQAGATVLEGSVASRGEVERSQHLKRP